MQTFRQRFFDFMSNINPLLIVFLMCVGFSILTYIIPGGQFERHTVMVMGRAAGNRCARVVSSHADRTRRASCNCGPYLCAGRWKAQSVPSSSCCPRARSPPSLQPEPSVPGSTRSSGKPGGLGIVFIPVIVLPLGSVARPSECTKKRFHLSSSSRR